MSQHIDVESIRRRVMYTSTPASARAQRQVDSIHIRWLRMPFAWCNQNVHSEAHKDITQARFLPSHLLHFSWLLFIAYAHEGMLRPSNALRSTLAKQNVHENARQS